MLKRTATALLFFGLMLQLVLPPVHGHAETQDTTLDAQAECTLCTGAGPDLLAVTAVDLPCAPLTVAYSATAFATMAPCEFAGNAPARAPPLALLPS